MIVTANKYVNARTSPSAAATNPFYLRPGDVLELTEVVVAERYDGSNIWYKAKDGHFFWSGGFTETEFSIIKTDVAALAAAPMQAVVDEAMTHFVTTFRNSVPHLVNVDVHCSTNAQGVLSCALQLSVARLTPQPAHVHFKGFAIPVNTVVVPAVTDTISYPFDDLNYSERAKILAEAKDQYKEEWTSLYSGMQSVTVGYKTKGGTTSQKLCLVFQVDQKGDAARKIPATIPYTAADGRSYELPTDVEEVGDTIATAVCARGTIKKSGCSVGRQNMRETGTIGLKVRRRNADGSTDFFVLSCYHVLCSPEIRKGEFTFVPSGASASAVVSPGVLDNGGDVIADVVEGKLSILIDAAIAMLRSPHLVDATIAEMSRPPIGIATLVKSDENVTTLKLSGRTSGIRKGMVKDVCTVANITYDVIGKFNIIDVIMTSKMSDPGDSGAAVLNLSNEVVGILVASNKRYSYVIPINRIIDPQNLNLEICFS